MKKIFFLLFTFLVFKSAFAYNFTSDFENGFYWEELPIKLAIDPKSPHKELLYDLTLDAVNDWKNASGESVWELVALNESTKGSHLIRWSDNFSEETGMDNGSVLAITARYTNGPYFTKAEIIINGSHETNENITKLFTVLIHELGHTIGLDHSELNDAVMYRHLIDKYEGISNDDSVGMQEVVSESKRRQSIRYQSPLSYKEEKVNKGVSCGTISDTNGGSGTGLMVLLSFMMGIVFASIARVFKLKIA